MVTTTEDSGQEAREDRPTCFGRHTNNSDCRACQHSRDCFENRSKPEPQQTVIAFPTPTNTKLDSLYVTLADWTGSQAKFVVDLLTVGWVDRATIVKRAGELFVAKGWIAVAIFDSLVQEGVLQAKGKPGNQSYHFGT
jgi:hypothetical protein